MASPPTVDPTVLASQAPQQIAANLVGAELERVEQKLLDLCGPGDDPLSLAVSGLVQAGGKRLRPTLVLLSALAVDRPTDLTTDLAVAVEVMHLASLMHDDVVDEAPMRRGKPTTHQLWGNRRAVLAGDYLAARAYYQLAALRDFASLHVLADAAMAMVRAEAATDPDQPDAPSPEDCLAVARGKTASLIAAACQVGAVSAGASEATGLAFHAYGEHLGLAFQITDDLLDLFGDESVIGKQPGRDILTGQWTLPIVCALASERGLQVRALIESLAAESCDAPDIAPLAALVEQAGGRAAAQDAAASQVALAHAALRDVPVAHPEAVVALGHLADSTLTRSR